MNNKKRLISLLLAGAITTTSIACLSSCSENENILSPDCNERKTFAIEMSLDANQQFFNIVSFDVELIDGKYYIKFLGHYDKGGMKDSIYGSGAYTYLDHKDYLITYEISKEEYKNIAIFYNNTKNGIRYLTLENLATLQSIVDNYDPISVEENTIDVQYKEHSY